MTQEIFVFGSNLRGVHGAGAAEYARLHHGAIWGVGEGIQGNSYGIPTKDIRIESLPLNEVYNHVRKFIAYATKHPEMTFNVTRIGCGLAGNKDHQIAPMFIGAPSNCKLPEGWDEYQ